MIGQELKILFTQNKAYLTSDRSISLEQAGLSDTIAIQKGFKAPAYWIFKVIDHIESKKRLYCEVLSYHIGETEFEYNQKQLSSGLNDIETVTFRRIDTGGLLKTVSGGINTISFVPSTRASTYTPQYHQSESVTSQPYKRTITETFSILLKNVRFILGGVTFNKKIEGYNKSIEFKIANYDIREEFDAIKNYFANVLKTKKIQVTATIELSDQEVTSKIAKSTEIDSINKDLIENVKFEIVRATRKKTSVGVDKNLFTMDEYLDTFADEKFPSNTFYNSDKEFLEDMLKISSTKHYNHLRLLSSKHSHDIMKLRIIQRPFSFLFLIQGDRNYHIIWETLDTTEATYVWHIVKDPSVLKLALQKLENTINVIIDKGKIAYLITTDDQFSRVYHDYSETAGGFVKWKDELERTLT